MFGLDLPALPESYVTRQVQCVCCQEPFVVAEGRIVPGVDGKSEPERRWRLSSDQNPSIRLRYLHNRYRQEVHLGSRATPNVNHEPEADEINKPDNYINCPRCGVDNRNWLEIISPRQHVGTGLLDMLLPMPLSQWRQRFSAAFVSIQVSIGLGFLVFSLFFLGIISFLQASLMAGAAILTAVGTADDLTKHWQQLRMEAHVRQLPIKRRRRLKLDSLVARGFILIVLFAAIFPWILFRAGPHSMQFAVNLLRPNNTAVLVNPKYPAELYDEFSYVFNSEISLFANDFGSMKLDELHTIIIAYEQFAQLDQNITAAAKQFETGVTYFINNPPKSPEQMQKEMDARTRKNIADNMFLLLWFIIVGTANFVAAFFSTKAAHRYANFVDSQLPPPIFSSVANMTRIVIWEAKRALQIDGDMSHIQWVEVHRNEVGGVNLYGLHREDPDRDNNNNLLSQKVRAQRYIVSTDMWGRIREVLVRDVRVPHTVAVPNRHRATERPEFLSHDPNDNSEPPSGDNLAQDFFSPAAPTGGGAARTPPEPTPDADSAVHAAPSRSYTHTLESQSPLHNRDELREKLAAILCQEFSLRELRLFYGDLGLNYDHLPGSRQEKCQDLVRFYYRRRRIPELVQQCVDSHPHFLWGDIFDLLDA